MVDSEKVSKELLELSSEQRLNIMLNLLEKKSKLSTMAKKLNATTPEVFRNFGRLTKAEMISKDSDGHYELTSYGKSMCMLFSNIVFLSENKKYFKNHYFGNLSEKFIQRIGALCEGQHISGFSKILECWKQMFENADEYIYGILYEEPLDLIEPIVNKARNGIKVSSIFSENAIIPKGRKKILEKLGFSDLIQNGSIQRKMKKDVKVVVVLNEKEATVMFPSLNGDVDMSKMFYGDTELFHEWCLDYFRYCWYGSETFSETKLNQ